MFARRMCLYEHLALRIILFKLMPPFRTERPDVFSIMLCAIGALLFVAAAFNWQSSSGSVQVNPEIYEADNTPFYFESLVTSHNYGFEQNIAAVNKEDFIFLYVMTPEVCGVCLNEVTGYIRLLEDEGFAGRSVQNVILVVGKDLEEAERFTRISYLPATAGFGYDPVLAPILTRFKDGSMPRQLIMIDPQTDTIFFRHLLRTGEMTDELLKQSVLKEARRALSNLR